MMRTALVTGAANGIGLAVAERLLADGLSVVLADRDAEGVHRAAAALDPTAERAVATHVDVTDRATVDAMVQGAVDRFGGLDVVVNIAGTPMLTPAGTVDDEAFGQAFDVHVTGALRCVRAAYPALRRSGSAAVVNMASMAGLVGMPDRVAYGSAKAGVIGMTRTLAIEWAPDGIRVNAVAPGPVLTARMQALGDAGTYDLDQMSSTLPLRRFCRPEEVAGPVAFLASADAGYVTGHVLTIDGGATVDGRI